MWRWTLERILTGNRDLHMVRSLLASVTSKKLPNIFKSYPKMISLKMKDFDTFENCLKCGQFGQNIWWHRLWKVAQSAIHHPIWPHWFQINFGKRNCPGQLLWHWFVGLAIGYSSSNDDDGTAHVKRLLLNCINLFDSKPGAECRAVVGREVCR